MKFQSHALGGLLAETCLCTVGTVLIEVTKRSTNQSREGSILYQGIEADRATDDIPSRAKGKSDETQLPKRRGGRHDVDERGSEPEKVHTEKVFMWGGGAIMTGAALV
jgi:hypothetical protein